MMSTPLAMADLASKDPPSMAASDSNEDESDSEPVELLVTGRERRKTAGNRYNRDMILEEIGDQDDLDEVALLFAGGEDEEDDEFKSDATEDDELSSSDDDDQGPNAGGDDLEGEKEMERQRKEERAKKRKAEIALTARTSIRKRPKIDPAAAKQPLPKKPSKKKERVTWLPDQDAGGRASLRKQTVAHREHTLARLRESEAQSKKLKALKEIRERERAKDAPKEMTQADRLAEAERVERRNAKSLNRWEAMERKRNEEQAARLAALKERKLEGPVITWWSGKAEWRRPLVTNAGIDNASPVDSLGEPKKRGRKPKALQGQLVGISQGASIPTTPTSIAQPSPLQQSTSISQQSTDVDQRAISLEQQPATVEKQPPKVEQHPQQPQQQQQQQQNSPELSQTPHIVSKIGSSPTIESTPVLSAQSVTPSQANSGVLLSEIHNNTSTPHDTPTGNVTGDTTISDKSMLRIATPHQDASPHATDASQTLMQSTATGGDASTPKIELQEINPALVAARPQIQPDTTSTDANNGPSSEPSLSVEIPVAPPEPVIIEEFTTRNLVVLDGFEDLSEQARLAYNVFFRNKRVPRPAQRRPDLCPITTQVARYKDPATGIGYANVVAYKLLQELQEHKFIWSAMLGCYVGRDGAPVARGVPEGYPG